MKKSILVLTLCALLAACSSKSEEIPEPAPENNAPETPILSTPADNLFCTTNTLEFSWLPAIDPEKDNVYYIIEIATNMDFSKPFLKTELSSTSLTTEVNKGQNYYWRVLAKDEKGNYSEYSIVRNFYTEDSQTSNSLPSVPDLVSPVDEIISGLEVELAWQATDADGEELSFDLFFGTNQTPTLWKENLTQNSYTITNLTPSTTYYWKIEVKDPNGGKTIGQTWSFQTK